MLAAVAAGSGVVALTDPTADWEQTGDPSTYLDTFAPDGAGFVTSLLGLF
jgi:hypothetical protein